MNNVLQKMKSFFKANSEVITPTAVLAIICVVVTLALSSTNLLTADRIEALSIETQNKAMAKLIEADEYPEITTKISSEDITYNTAIKNGEIIGYIFKTSAKGYGGDVQVMTAIDINGAITAIEITDASGETPGLGQNVTKENFYGQFKGASGEINAVTGATISSKAVTAAVNQALDYAAEIIVKED